MQMILLSISALIVLQKTYFQSNCFLTYKKIYSLKRKNRSQVSEIQLFVQNKKFFFLLFQTN